jgi:hypothetical protein
MEFLWNVVALQPFFAASSAFDSFIDDGFVSLTLSFLEE